MALSIADSLTFEPTAGDFQEPEALFLLAGNKAFNFYWDIGGAVDRIGHVLTWSDPTLSDGSHQASPTTIYSVVPGPYAKSPIGYALLARFDSPTFYAHTISISGTTVTFNSQVSIETVNVLGGQIAISGNSSGTIGLVCYRTDVTSTRLCRFTLSGSTLTPGTPQDHSASPNFLPTGMAPVSATKVVMIGKNLSTNKWALQIIDIGSGITEGTLKDTTLNTSVAIINPNQIVSPDAAKVVACFDSGGPRLIAGSISGTTITLGSPQLVNGIATASSLDVVGDEGVVVYQLSGNTKIQTFSLSGLAITLGGDDINLGAEGTRGATAVRIISSGYAMAAWDEATNIGEAAVIGGLPIGGGPAVSGKLWVYKTQDGALTWENKEVYTA